MAYFGTTAASSVANPPVCISPTLSPQTILATTRSTGWDATAVRAGGMKTWRYISTNLTTDLTVVGFFTDGDKLGMRNGDVLEAVSYTSAGSSFVLVRGILVTTNSTAGFNISTGGTMTSTFA